MSPPVVDERTPNLFILGAPKAGTTFLYHALDLAPSVFMSPVKEPGYFISARDQRRGLGYYLGAYFRGAKGFATRGECTPWYLYSPEAAQRIKEMPAQEPPHLVIVLRRPSARALSMYLDQHGLHVERRSFAEAIDAELESLTTTDPYPDAIPHPEMIGRYVWCGLYSQHIERWQAQFGADRVHLIVMEEMIADPDRAWHDLAEFLGRDLGPSQFDAVGIDERNVSSTLRWPRLHAMLRAFEGRENPAIEVAKRVLPPGLHRRALQRLGRINRTARSEGVGDEREEVLRALDAFYEPEVARVEALLGRSVDAWRSEPGRAPAAEAPSAVSVLHLTTRSHRRGAELVAIELASELDLLGFKNRVVALAPGTSGAQEPGITPLSTANHLRRGDLLPRVVAVRRLLKRHHVDVVLAHGGWAAQVAALASPRHGPVLVWQRILGFPDAMWGPARRRWWHTIARRFDAGVALTRELKDEQRRLGFDGPVWIIPNSRRPQQYLALDRVEAASKLRADIGVSDDVPLIGFVGHLVAQKRPQRAVEVLARVRALGCPAHLVVSGDGPLRGDLERDIARRALERSVTLLGHRPDVESVFGGVELALLTSDAEGIPGVAIEAVMAGCPLISFPVGGVNEVIDQGETGIVIDGFDTDAMAAVVVELLGDGPRLRAMSEAGREQIDRFSAARTAAVYAERFTAMLEAAGRTGR